MSLARNHNLCHALSMQPIETLAETEPSKRDATSAAEASRWLQNPTTPIQRKRLLDLWTEQLAREDKCPSPK